MPKPRRKPTPAPSPKRARRLWWNVATAALALAVVAILVVLSAMPNGAPRRTSGPTPAKAAPLRAAGEADYARFAQLSARDLVAMSDAELEAMDPLVMNMVVAKALPELAGIDFAKYARTVDGWAERIAQGIAAGEADAAFTSPAYRADPDIWRAGSMAIALASPQVGIGYTRDVQMTNHADLFVPGLIDTKRGTCSNMPVLYMAVAHRLRWPLKAVVAADHMWCRWDDGTKRFNLEATSTKSGGGEGSFSTPPDEAYRADLNVSAKAEEVGSDLATLTARQTLGVYLQQRAGYWRATGNPEAEEADLLLAALCFPDNRDICWGLMRAMDGRVKRLFAPEEVARMFAREDPAAAQARRRAEQDRLRQQMAEVDRINRENQRRREQYREPPQ